MAQPAKRRGHGEDAIYWDESKGRWYGSVSVGRLEPWLRSKLLRSLLTAIFLGA